MLMFICLKPKNIVSSGRAPLVRLVSSLQSQRYSWKGDFYICVPMIWEFKVFVMWKLRALLKDPARTGSAVWRKRESSCYLLCAVLAVFWPCGWFQEIGGEKTGTAQEEVTGFVKPVSLTWLSLLRTAVLTAHFRKFQFYKSAFCTSFICSL